MRKSLVKSIKKVMALTLCIVMLSGMDVLAANIVEFHVENQGGKAGDVITVPVELTSGEEVGGFEIVVYYDSEMMEFQKLKKGDLIIEEDGLFDYNAEYGEGAIKIVFVVVDTVKAEGVISNISFRLKKDCDEGLPIGVGIDQVIDDSEDSKEIQGTVTGVDEAFQETVAQRAMEIEAQRQGKSESTDNETESEKPENVKPENEELKKEESKIFAVTENTENHKTEVIVTGFVVVIIMLGLLIVWRKRKRYGKSDSN